MPPVTTVTTRAESADRLTPADYRDIYQEVRGYDPVTGEYRVSLRALVDLIQQQLPGQACLSIAYWSKYHKGELDTLNRRARQELRALVGQPALPPTVAEACATADPDATVYQVGTATPDRIVLVGSDIHDPLALRLNGHLEATGDPVAESHVTPVTRARLRLPTKAVRLSPDNWNRLSTLRKKAGMTWDEFAAWVAELCGA